MPKRKKYTMTSRTRLFIQKIPYGASIDRIIPFSNELTKTAKNFDGFIDSNSYWPANSVDNILFTFTTWRSSNDWENWYNSLERKDIFAKHNIQFTTKITPLITKKDPNDDFLL